MLPVVVPLEQAIENMVVYTALLVLTSLALVPVGELGWIYGITAVVSALYIMNVGLDEIFNPKLRQT